MSKRALPMPVDVVLHCPVLASCDGSTYRIAIALTLAFWQGECRPLPDNDAGLCALARCGTSGWRKSKATVMAALAMILPELDRRYARAVQRAESFHQARVAAGRKGAFARWYGPKASAIEDSPLLDRPVNAGPPKVHFARRNPVFNAGPQPIAPLSESGMLRDI